MVAATQIALDSVWAEDQLVTETRRELLEVMDRLGDEVGIWQNHIPFEAALRFFEDDSIHEMYSAHVDECSYCQGMLAAMQPSDEAKTEFEVAVMWAVEEQPQEDTESEKSLAHRIASFFEKDRRVPA